MTPDRRAAPPTGEHPERPERAEPPAVEPPALPDTAPMTQPTQSASQPATQPMTAPGAAVPAERPLFDIDSWMDAPPGTVPGLTDTRAADDDLGRAFAPERFQEYDEVLPGEAREPVPAGVSPYGMPPDDAPAREAGSPAALRALLWLGGTAAALLALVAVFAAGRGMAGILSGRVDALPTPPAASPAATGAPAIPTALAEPGIRPWDRLAGGECLQGFSGAWAQSFTVVECSRPHTAQLLLRAPFPDARKAAYPGATALQQRMPALCSAPGVVDLAKAGAASDLQLSYAFPATRDQWQDGDRDYWCFASRSSGAPIAGSIAAGAQQAVWAARAQATATSGPSPGPNRTRAPK